MIRLRHLAAIGMAFALLAGTDESTVQKVGDALAAGTRATDLRGRTAAADVLIALGATPADGQQDLGKTWRDGRHLTAIAYRDRVLGPVYRGLTLEPGAAVQFEQSFYAGQTAHVAVSAVDRLPVTLQVFDDEGKARCGIVGTTCEWVPSWTTRARVEIKNKGARRGTFFVVIQ